MDGKSTDAVLDTTRSSYDESIGEYRRELQQLYQIRIETSVYMVNLSEQCESVDNILTDRILNNGLSDTEHETKSDKSFTYIKDDKSLSYLVPDKVA
jgi:hypothetical protein